MFVPFPSISSGSRVWIYQASEKLSGSAKITADKMLRSFTEQWTAHGVPLQASYDIRFDQFLILAADEDASEASGCSIDESVRVIKDIGNRLGTKLFDRQQAAFLIKDTVTLIPLTELKENFRNGIWNESTLAFNNLVGVKAQLESQWILPAGQTWLRRYMETPKVIT